MADYTLIEQQDDFDTFLSAHQHTPWLGFDTEFVGERRYLPLLCVLQIATEQGYYIVDTLAVSDLHGFAQLLERKDILKITHAGENDYQLFYNNYGTLPHNVFDTQIAAGFMGYGYPTSFQKLLEQELNVRISKSQTVSDWAARPMSSKQVQYALNDVLHLRKLYDQMSAQLQQDQKLTWAIEECEAQLTAASAYERDDLRPLARYRNFHRLSLQQQVFMLRLYRWREEQARAQNISREMVLASKHLPAIVKLINSGKQTLLGDRRLPSKIVHKHWDTLSDLFNRRATDEERELVTNIPRVPKRKPRQEILMDILNQILKYRCIEYGVAPILLLSRDELDRMKASKDYVPPQLLEGWRHQILGDDLLAWVRRRERLALVVQEGRVILE